VGRLDGKRCLVTGAARGIGLRCAGLMASEGAKVALSDIDLPAVEKAASEIGKGAIAVGLDVTSKSDWNSAMTETVSAFGGLEVLVNNAGICIPGTVEDLQEEDWDRTIDTDLKSVYLGCQAAMPVLAKNQPAAIVNIASISSMIAGHNLVAYNAAKAGVHMLTKSVALHAARTHSGVRCNSVHPAFVDTGMIDDVVKAGSPAAAREKLKRQIPLNRLATVDDVAYAVLYLVSDESAFVTGAELKLDGGLSAM